jgi:hypothetical protein
MILRTAFLLLVAATLAACNSTGANYNYKDYQQDQIDDAIDNSLDDLDSNDIAQLNSL